jgi:hypothetical protein
MKREDTIRLLEEVINEAKLLKAQSEFDQTFQQWKSKVQLILSDLIPLSRKVLRQFSTIRFGYVSDPRNPHQQLNNFSKALNEATDLLQNFKRQVAGLVFYVLSIKSLSDRVLHIVQRPPRGFIWGIISGIIIIVGGYLVITYVIPKLLPNPSNVENSSWRLTEVSLYNWIEDFDANLMRPFDSLVADFAGRGVLQSGEVMQHFIRYFQEKRRERDNTMDSFLVAYSVQGGDTLALHYKRKLPINVFQVLNGRSPDFAMLFGGLRLDTL